jgi:chemotaxis-related protein WspB
MLMLLFYVGNERYAISAKRVVEVVPMVSLKKVYHAPEYVAGLFNYRGQIVPVIDVCHLIQGHPCRLHLSTRIVVINFQNPDAISPGNSQHNQRLLGLMAERVTETMNKPEIELLPPTITVDASPYLGGIISDEQGMIQYLCVENLLPQSQSSYLLPQQESFSS